DVAPQAQNIRRPDLRSLSVHLWNRTLLSRILAQRSWPWFRLWRRHEWNSTHRDWIGLGRGPDLVATPGLQASRPPPGKRHSLSPWQTKVVGFDSPIRPEFAPHRGCNTAYLVTA